jgi:predicted nucleic acid-binding protein
MNYMFDACALIALLNGEADKTAVVKDLLTQARQGKAQIYMSIVNFTEVYYDRLKLERPDLANAFLEYIPLLPITILETVSRDISLEAGRIKVSHKMSLADSFLLATAHLYSAAVVTSDYGELETVEQNISIPFCGYVPNRNLAISKFISCKFCPLSFLIYFNSIILAAACSRSSHFP